jgi:hypothetical protein
MLLFHRLKTYGYLVPVLVVVLITLASPVFALEESRLPDGSSAKDRDVFGSNVSISGDFALVGAAMLAEDSPPLIISAAGKLD